MKMENLQRASLNISISVVIEHLIDLYRWWHPKTIYISIHADMHYGCTVHTFSGITHFHAISIYGWKWEVIFTTEWLVSNWVNVCVWEVNLINFITNGVIIRIFVQKHCQFYFRNDFDVTQTHNISCSRA